eukprot:26629-Eustigmatos_ZCMA.PRE.1
MRLLAKYLEEHVANVCGYRVLRCECGEDVVAFYMDLHRKNDCQAALKYCPLGCGTKVCLASPATHGVPDST